MGLFDFNINPHVDVHINTEEIAGSNYNYKAKVLKPNLVDGVNTLAQEMIDECGANTVFVIKYDYQIDETIAFPENSVIHFDGGSFNGGTVVGNNTKVFNPYETEAFNGTAKQGTFVDLSAVDWEEISNKPSFATVATTGSYNDLTDKPVIPTGQVQSDWNQTNTSAPDYIKGKPAKLSDFTDDSSFVNGASYDSQNKRINFKHNNTVVAWIDAAPFIIDGMVSDVKIVSGNLVVKFNTDAGKQDLIIPLTDIFNPNNYYTKAQVDTELDKKADASSLANVATSGNYNDLNNKPAIPVVPTKVSAFDNDAKYVKQESLENFLDVTSTKGQTIRGELTLCAGATIPSLEKLDVLGNIESVNGFKKKDSSDDYVLLAGGGTKALSEIEPSEFNGVTLDTKQTITGEKWFSKDVRFLGDSLLTVYNSIKVGEGDSYTWIEPWRIELSHVISPAPRRTAETILDAEGITSPQFIVEGGTSSQFLKADGSLDSNEYLPLSGGTLTGWLYFNSSDYKIGYYTEPGEPSLLINSENHIELAAGGNIDLEADKTFCWGSIQAKSFIKEGGTSAQFLKADGSVDENAYLPLSGGTITGLLNVGGEPEGSEYGIYTPWDIYAGSGLNSGGRIFLTSQNVISLGIRVEGAVRNSFSIGIEDSALENNYWQTRCMNILSKFKVGWTNNTDNTFYADAGTGKVGIGTSSPSYKLDVNGQVGATEFVTTSDETLKNKTGDINLTAEDIANAPAIKFTWKDEKKGQEVNVGTIAQYWEKVLPEVVSKDNDDKLALNYSALATVSAISLAKEVVALREKVSTLEERLAKLEQLMTNK